MHKVRVLVLAGYGINCEEETGEAFELAGAEVCIVHLKEIFSERVSLFDFDIFVFPGGFSYGDDLGAGRVLAQSLKYRKLISGVSFFQQLLKFLDLGGQILGICNGFQILLILGLLPGIDRNYKQNASLVLNDSGKFEDRWCGCVVPDGVDVPMFRGVRFLDLPLRHAEGKLVVKDLSVVREIVNRKLICLKYCDEKGNPTQVYPMNPNGSFLSCAGLTNPNGQIIGLMPHPEAYLSVYNHPNWGAKLRLNSKISLDGEGVQLFKNIVQQIKVKKKHDQASSYKCI